MPQFMPKVDEEFMRYLILMREKYRPDLKSYNDVLDITNCTKADNIIVYSSIELQLTPRVFNDERCIYLGNKFDITYKSSANSLLRLF